MRCKKCHYSLANLTGPPHRCPECGREFDPNDPGTYDIPGLTIRWRRLIVCAIAGLLGTALVAWLFQSTYVPRADLLQVTLVTTAGMSPIGFLAALVVYDRFVPYAKDQKPPSSVDSG